MKCDNLNPSHRYRFGVIAFTAVGQSTRKEIDGADITLPPGIFFLN